MVCQICGAYSGYYPLCKKHNAMKQSGKVKKCDSCLKWIDTGLPLCKKCWKEEQDLREQAKRKGIEKRKPRAKSPTKQPIVLDTVKVVGNRDLRNVIEKTIEDAEKSVYILSPYIEKFGHLFEDLENLIESKGSIKIVFNVADSYKNEQAVESLLEMKAQLKLDEDLHAKLVIVDEKIAIISSANLLARSFLNNKELGVYLTKPEQVKDAISYFNQVYEKARDVDEKIPDKKTQKRKQPVTPKGSGKKGKP
ncbi:MAG: phosphatidylserine/phosphatidylglycerophosphate/cardiolipin synthase family protein [Candidatus Odinarchaeota archaeon]